MTYLHFSFTKSFSCLVFLQMTVWYLLPALFQPHVFGQCELRGTTGQEWRIKSSQPTYCSHRISVMRRSHNCSEHPFFLRKKMDSSLRFWKFLPLQLYSIPVDWIKKANGIKKMEKVAVIRNILHASLQSCFFNAQSFRCLSLP